MIIVLTPEQSDINERPILHELFDAGLELFHIRKHWLNDEEMSAYLNAINPQYYQRLVLHSHHQLAAAHGIERLHFREEDRLAHKHSAYKNGYRLSTSVHDIDTFNQLGKEWQYAFLSPMYASISKQGYGTAYTSLAALSQRKNDHCQLIGLGGIDVNNFQPVLREGADGIALLGSIWLGPDPVKVYKTIKAAYELYRK